MKPIPSFIKKQTLSVLFGTLTLLPANFSWAESPTLPKNTVNVIANRVPVAIERSGGSSTTVITSEQIEASQQNQVAELLKSVPGIDIVANGGPGTPTSVFIRGNDSKNTLLLIDGIPFNDPSSTNRIANFGALSLDNVDRIEIIRGAQSVLYGSNATAGVINIITKKGTKPHAITLRAVGGSFGYQEFQATSTGQAGILNYSVAIAETRIDGYSIANDRNDDIPQDGNTNEEDGFQNKVLSANLGFELTKNLELEYIARSIDTQVDQDDWSGSWAGDQFGFDPNTFASVPEPDGKKKQQNRDFQSLNALKLHYHTDDRFFESTLTASQTRQQHEGRDANGDRSFEALGDADFQTWQGTFHFDLASLSFGLDQYTEHYDDRAGTEETATIQSYWVHSLFYLLNEDFVMGVGARNDQHEEFGSATTYRLTPSYQLGNLQLKASYGTGFRAPSLYELYSIFGNEDLDPERSTTWDIGFEHQVSGRVLYGVTWFDSLFEDRIDWVSDFSNPLGGAYDQVDGETKTNGAESFVSYHPTQRFSLHVNHTYLHTEDPDGHRLARRPQHKLFLQSIYDVTESTVLNTSTQWAGERDAIEFALKEDGEPVETLDAYMLLNLAVTQTFTDYLEGFVRVDNVTDEVYETAWSYAQSPRAGYLGLKAMF